MKSDQMVTRQGSVPELIGFTVTGIGPISDDGRRFHEINGKIVYITDSFPVPEEPDWNESLFTKIMSWICSFKC